MSDNRKHDELAGILLHQLRNLIDGNQARADDVVPGAYEAEDFRVRLFVLWSFFGRMEDSVTAGDASMKDHFGYNGAAFARHSGNCRNGRPAIRICGRALWTGCVLRAGKVWPNRGGKRLSILSGRFPCMSNANPATARAMSHATPAKDRGGSGVIGAAVRGNMPSRCRYMTATANTGVRGRCTKAAAVAGAADTGRAVRVRAAAGKNAAIVRATAFLPVSEKYRHWPCRRTRWLRIRGLPLRR